MAPIYSGDVDVAPADEDISSLRSSLGSTIAASAMEGLESSPLAQLGRMSEMSAASGIMPDLGGGVAPPALIDAITNAPEISREDAQARVKAAGLDKQVDLPNTPHLKAGAVDLMIQHAQEENARQATIAAGPRGFVPGALDAGTSFLVGAADPLNIAASFVPVVGEARYAKLMAGAGQSILARAAVRFGTGAIGGAAFSAGFLPLDWAANTSDGRDFTLTQALGQVLAGAGQFGVLHVGGGLMADFWRSLGPTRARRPLYPFAPGEPFERRAAVEPTIQPAAGEPAAAAPAAAGAETTPAAKAALPAGAPAEEAAGTVRAAAPRPAQPAPAGQAGRSLEDVLANPRVAERFANLKIDSDHKVPFGAGADVNDPNLVHVDESIPHRDVINGVAYDPREPVALHEIDEKDAMDEGMAYPPAHRTRGETAEKAWVDEHLGPGAWPIYTRRWDGWLAHTEHENIEDVPEGLYTKPYPFKERERIERLQRHERASAAERKTIAREVSTAVECAGRPREEARAAGELFAARYATRAARFGYRAGSALDLFRAEHLGIRSGEPNFIYSGRALEQRRPSAPDLFAQREAEGQQNLAGTERIGQGELAQRKANEPLKPRVEQKPMDVGLFSNDAAQKTLFQEAAPPHWYYSAAGRAIEGAKQEKASPEQWLGYLKNAAGVKAEELEWLGLPDWLKEHKGAVTRAELSEYIRANQIEVREVEQSDALNPLRARAEDVNARLISRYGSLENAFQRWTRAEEEEFERTHAEASAVDQAAGPGTQYGQYTLAGGENYRELLLTLPVEPGEIGRVRDRFQELNDRIDEIERRGGTAPQALYDELLQLRERLDGHPNPWLQHPAPGYRSAHWDPPNVLAHIRFDDRVTDGKKTLHIAEVQSDWHQAGRKRGYFEPASPEHLAEAERIGQREEFQRQVDEANRIRVPDAPFKTTWPELALKRMFRYAAENGYDRLTWDTGETNAERYDLSKQIEKIGASRNADGSFYVRYWEKGERDSRLLGDRLSEAQLADHVGKDLAGKIAAQGDDGSHAYTGLDLKVGGEGMRGFYDKILPAAANKLVKKFGAKVGESELEHEGDEEAFRVAERSGDSQAIADAAAMRRTPVHSVDITPQLREAALSHGFPLFQSGRDFEAGSRSVSGRPQGGALEQGVAPPALEGAPGDLNITPRERVDNLAPRGRITLASNRSVIDLFKAADASTFFHEAGHLWLEELVRDAAHEDAPAQIRDDLSTVLKWLGVDKPESIGTEHHEQWARGFEQYLMEGRAPSKGLAAVFEKFREWLAALYRSVTALNVPLNDEIRGVMDRMLASDPEIADMQRSLRSLPDNAKTDLLKATIGSVADGKPAPAAQMIDAAKEHPAVERAAQAVIDRLENTGETDPNEIWREISAVPAPHEEEAAKEAFAAAEKLPEPPAVDAEPPRTTSLAAARRAAAEGADVDIQVNKPTPRGPRARPEATWSLMEFLASRGGIDPRDPLIADLRALLGRSNKFVPGFGHLIRKGGMGLDRAREAAVEASYLRDRGQTENETGTAQTTVNDLLEALDEEARGRRSYREGAGAPEAQADPVEVERYRDEQAQAGAAFDEAMHEADISPENIAPELRARTLEIMTREGEADPHLAFERAVMERAVNEAETGQFERHPEAVPGWDEPDDAGAASHAGGAPAGAAGGERQEAGPGARTGSEGAGKAREQAGLDRLALTPIAKAAVAADARSAANFEIEAAEFDPADRTRVEDAIAAVDHEAQATVDVVHEAAAALGAGADTAGAIERAVAAVGDRAGRAEIEQEVQSLDGAIKVFMQDGLSKGEAAQRAADARLDKAAERAAIARRAEREHGIAIIRERKRLEALQKQGVSVRDGLEAITGGVNTPFFRSRDSIEARWHTLHNKYVGDGGVDGALRREGLARLAYSKTIDADIEREAYELDLGDKDKPGVTKNPQALRIAQIFHAADKQAMEDHNLAGGWLRSLSGHTAKQQWNPAAIRAASLGGNARGVTRDFRPGTAGTEEDRRAFMRDFLDNLDLKRTFGRMPMQEIRDALYQLWVPLKNGDHFDYALPSEDPVFPNVSGKAAAQRQFFFKSAEAARAMRQKYGLYPSFIESKYRGWETLSRQTALIGRLGPKPEEAIREIRDSALKMTEATNQRQAVEKFASGRGGGYEMSMLDKQMGLLTGKANKPLWQLGARIAAGWMVWERMSMLGRVLITHIEGLPTKSSELRYWGASAAQRYRGFLSDMRRAAPESERGRLMQLIWAGHDADNAYRAARYDSADTSPGILSRLSDVYFRLTGVTHVLPNQRQGAQHVMARELGMERGKAWDQVDPRVTRILQMYGIGEPEWQLLHGAEWTRGRTPDGAGPGGSSENAFLTPEDALKLDDASLKAYLEKKHPYERPADAPLAVTPEQVARARNDLAWAIATMYEDRGAFAMFQGASVRTKARLYGNSQPGTVGGVALRLLWQFKQWPVEMIYRTWGREIYGGQQGMGRVASIVELAVAATVMGTLGEMVRDTLKGEDPLPAFEAHPIQYLARGMMRSGVGSIAGDYLLGEFDRHFRTVLESIAGPTLGQINDLADLYYGGGAESRHPWSQRAADLLQLVKTNGGPLLNFWATSWAFQYLVLFRLQEWMHPGYVERYQRKMEKEGGVSFMVSPQAAIGR